MNNDMQGNGIALVTVSIDPCEALELFKLQR